MASNSRVVIAQCTGDKRALADGETVAARELYDKSSYFRKQRAYAEAVADRWYIQSAEHGLVHPNDELAYYEKHAKDLDYRPEWSQEIADDLEDRIEDEATIELLGGQLYTEYLVPALEARGFSVEEPLAGLRIGARESRLDELVNTSLEAFK